MSRPLAPTVGRLSVRERLVSPSLGAVVGVFVAAAGMAIGLRPLSDNSFLTHLATGRLILDSGRVPSVDPYTFTAQGEPWVVQSWLASTAYATAEAVGGLGGVRVLAGLVAGVVAALGWRLLRPADSIIVRMALAAVFVAAGAELWSERPFMLGLAAFACTMLAAEGGLDPRWLVPLGWFWVNVHGSFPLGIVYLLAVAAGTHLDGDRPRLEMRCARWAGLGMLLGAVGPLGPRALLFPVALLRRRDQLSQVIEWRAPDFEIFSERAFLLQVLVVLILLARRPSYRAALVVAVFVGASLLGARNMVVASLVMLPVMAGAVGEIGALRSADRPRVARLLVVAGVTLSVVLAAGRLGEEHLDVSRYPERPIAYLEGSGIDARDHRLAAPDLVGNFQELVYGADGRVFYDDRFDMFPTEISDAHLALLNVTPDVHHELGALGIELVVVQRSGAMGQVLVADRTWRLLLIEDDWILACRRAVQLSPSISC